MKISEELKRNLIADVENICDINLSDETKESLKRCFEITIGHVYHAQLESEESLTDEKGVSDIDIEKILEIMQQEFAHLNMVQACKVAERIIALKTQGQKVSDKDIEIFYPSEVGQSVTMEKDKTYDEVRLANYYRRQGARAFRDGKIKPST
jgi:hypothetical protein